MKSLVYIYVIYDVCVCVRMCVHLYRREHAYTRETEKEIRKLKKKNPKFPQASYWRLYYTVYTLYLSLLLYPRIYLNPLLAL